jgi:hypothetical protein
VKALARDFTARKTGGDKPSRQRRLLGSRVVVALIGLSFAAYAMALVLPNFEFCYYTGCGKPAGWEYVFGTTFGSALLVVAFVLAHVSFWLSAALLLGGVRRRWVAIALVPYAAFCGWLVWLFLVAYPGFFQHLMVGWWLWLAAGALLVTAILAARSPTKRPGMRSTHKGAT